MFVAADPVAQVKAPEAVNWRLARAGINAVAVPAKVAASHLLGFVNESMALGNARGLMVSIPYKTALVDMLGRLAPQARMAGSVNAVRRASDGALEGALFDGAGFLGALRYHGVELEGARTLLLGAGGTGLAIAAALSSEPLKSLSVYDANAARGAALTARVADRAPFAVKATSDNGPEGCDLVINATPLGLRLDDPLPIDPQRLDPGATVVDILMTAQPTHHVRLSRQRGLRAYMGHEMLVQQLPSYLEYFGHGELACSLRAEHADWLDDVRGLLGARCAAG